jgi:hypothetical protein
MSFDFGNLLHRVNTNEHNAYINAAEHRQATENLRTEVQSLAVSVKAISDYIKNTAADVSAPSLPKPPTPSFKPSGVITLPSLIKSLKLKMFPLDNNINLIYKILTSLTNFGFLSFIFSACNICPCCKHPLRYFCDTSNTPTPLPSNNPKKSIRESTNPVLPIVKKESNNPKKARTHQNSTPLPSSNLYTLKKDSNKPPKNIRTRTWCFTLNNYTQADLVFFNSSDSFTYQYLCYGLVVGALNTPHMQGFFYYSNPISIYTLKALLSSSF